MKEREKRKNKRIVYNGSICFLSLPSFFILFKHVQRLPGLYRLAVSSFKVMKLNLFNDSYFELHCCHRLMHWESHRCLYW